jgi:hypothetical protein
MPSLPSRKYLWILAADRLISDISYPCGVFQKN